MPAKLRLVDTVKKLNGVGPQLEKKLNKLGIETIQDILFHLPYRYIDRTHLSPLGSLLHGQFAYIQGTIELAQVSFGKRRSLLVQISDGTGSLVLRFFYFSKTQQLAMEKGKTIRCYGQARRGNKSIEMVHPEYRYVENDMPIQLEEALTPVYRLTEGLQQNRLRSIAQQALGYLKNESLTDLLPDASLQLANLPSLSDALAYVHHPPPDANIKALLEGNHPTQQRLAFEELLAHHLSLRNLRNEIKSEAGIAMQDAEALQDTFLSSLGFELTNAQNKACEEIKKDLLLERAMLRLVQGDVGCGKTVVAAHATLQVIQNNYQVAIMAPTEILAEQHYESFAKWFEPLNIQIYFLTGKLKKSEQTEIKEKLAEQKPFVCIGTHALFQKDALFGNLGLIIIDEQHRFGVEQRLALLEKGRTDKYLPHQLIMTATPIPRTLAMTAYAELDTTIIDELPPNRQTVETVAISIDRRIDLIQRIKAACDDGRQVYWVCTLIEESDVLDCQPAIDAHKDLQAQLVEHNIGLVHGRMKADEKEAMMREFKTGKIHVLVATTVIEVGVDVPNASLMIIENAERLGLSQLHQLRGRVGRGSIKSDCVLLYRAPLSDHAKARIDTMRKTNDGFTIAEKDLQLRGPGEVLGTRQTGIAEMQIADVIRDAELINDVEKVAEQLFNEYPERVTSIIQRWLGKNIEYSIV